jgi:pimeloyl-ACP methyl ester carboxylesterase
MAVFVLVHGAWHGAWCWGRIVPRLEGRGHRAVAVDLPGSGASPVAVELATLARSVRYLGEVLATLAEPAIMVAHSLGGVTLTQTAEEFPERIRKLIYLAAILPEDGESSIQALGRLAPDHPRMPVNRILDGAAVELDPAGVADLLYGTCLPEDVAWAKARLRPNAVEPMVAPVARSADRFGRVPRAYIECLRDNAIPIAAQRGMAASSPGSEIATLDTDHSPFLCAPDALTAILDRLAV